MQITIDSSETSAALRLAAAMLTFIANHKDSPQPNFAPSATVTAPAPEAPPAPEASNFPSAPIDTSSPDVTVTGIEPLVDIAGVTWNPELHTANQSKNSDGTWRRKRTQKGEQAAQPKVVEIPPPPTVEQPAIVPPAPITETVTPVPVVPPTPPVSTVASSTTGITTFLALVKYATNLVGTKKLTTAQLLEACAESGVRDIHACSLPENSALIPVVATAIEKRAA